MLVGVSEGRVICLPRRGNRVDYAQQRLNEYARLGLCSTRHPAKEPVGHNASAGRTARSHEHLRLEGSIGVITVVSTAPAHEA